MWQLKEANLLKGTTIKVLRDILLVKSIVNQTLLSRSFLGIRIGVEIDSKKENLLK